MSDKKNRNLDGKLLAAVELFREESSRDERVDCILALLENDSEWSEILHDVRVLRAQRSQAEIEALAMAAATRHIPALVRELTDADSPPWDALGEAVTNELSGAYPHLLMTPENVERAVEKAKTTWANRLRIRMFHASALDGAPSKG